VERVEKYLQNELLVEDGEVILVGVSGGVDSVVLLDILHVLSFEHGYTIYVAHVNHGLRGAQAKRDEKFVRSLAQKYDVQCHATTVQVKDFAKKHSLTEEAAARELRYKFFRQTSSTLRAGVCATAHTADDAAETLLMNLFRGTGLSGLAGIPPRRTLVKKTQLVRPLLQISKEEIKEYAEQRELEWYEDETNSITTYTRNKVRHDVLPKLKEEFNPKIIESLNRTATLLRRADGFIESFIDSTYHSVVVEKEDSCVIDINKLEVLHEFLQSEIIERCISTLTFGYLVKNRVLARISSTILLLCAIAMKLFSCMNNTYKRCF
jgi:tRNA(Ile)-lysidine synthase